MIFRRLVVAAALSWMAAAGAAAAQETDRIALAREVIALMEVTQVVDQMFQNLTPIIAAGMAQEMALSQADTARLTTILGEEFRAAMPELIESVSRTYAAHLTQQNLTEIRDFLQSPSGQAMVSSQGRVQQELESVGETLGMRVALQALARFQAGQ